MGSIRDILEGFVTRTKQMYEYTELNDHGEPLDHFEKEFQKLREITLKYRTEKTFATVHGENEYNIKKNRYKDILPYDYTRVVLSQIPSEPQSDYINANWVKGAMGQTVYIASQGPMPATVNDFWRMLWEYDVNIVVMVCNEYEGRKLKCEKYWAEGDESHMFGNIRVSLHDSISPTFKRKEREETSLADCRVRHLKAEFNNKSRHLIQFHYTAWPDHGIPEQVSPILDMVAMMREYQPNDDRNIVIHCSAGCGRTGTVIAIDYCWNLLKMGMLKPNFRLFDVIYEMRQQRPSFVQTKEQYMLVHKAVMELYQRHLDMIEEHIYSNVDAEHMYTNTEPDFHRLAGFKTQASTVYSVETEKVSKSSPAYLSVQRWVCQNGNLEPATRRSLQQAPVSHKQPQASPRTSLSPDRPEAYETVEIEKASLSETEAAPQAYSQVQGRQIGVFNSGLLIDFGELEKKPSHSETDEVYAQVQRKPKVSGTVATGLLIDIEAEPCVHHRSSTDNDYSPVGWQLQDSVSPVEPEYEHVFQPRLSSEDEIQPPPVPTKNLSSPQVTDKISPHPMEGSIGDKAGTMFRKFKNVFKTTDSNKGPTQVVSSSNSQIFFKGQDISFGKRVGRPAGPRESNHTAAH